MGKTAHIIKAGRIPVTGKYKLQLGQAAAIDKATPARPRLGQGAASAKVINANASYAMIEVTCPCGEKLQLKCRYASDPAASADNTEVKK